MALGLGDLLHVHEYRSVVVATVGCGTFVGGDQLRVVPAFGAENLKPVGGAAFFKPGQGFTDGLLDGLVFLLDTDAVPVVPHAHKHGHFQHAGRVHGFPEEAFGGGRIANGTESNLVASVGEVGHLSRQLGLGFVDLGGLRESEQAGHLTCGG